MKHEQIFHAFMYGRQPEYTVCNNTWVSHTEYQVFALCLVTENLQLQNGQQCTYFMNQCDMIGDISCTNFLIMIILCFTHFPLRHNYVINTFEPSVNYICLLKSKPGGIHAELSNVQDVFCQYQVLLTTLKMITHIIFILYSILHNNYMIQY